MSAHAEAPTGAAAAGFGGFHLGLEGGLQNVIGGSLIDGVDVLQQDSRAVVSLLAGARVQFAGGFVAGFEGGAGLVDGDLRLSDPARSLSVRYDTRTQTHYGLIAGHTLGVAGRTLVFGYVSETRRTFDVTIESPFGTFTQRDEQGLLRYGMGLERTIGGPLRMRASLGSSRADFGDRPTNMEVETKVDASLGVIYRP